MKGKSQCCLWLGVNAFAAYDLERPIAFGLICDGINADGGYIPVPLGYMRIISTRLMPRVGGSIARSRRHSASSAAADLRGISSTKVLRLRDIDLLEAALLPRKLKPGPAHSIHVSAGEQALAR